MKHSTLFWIFFVGFVVIDQLVKAWARGAMDVGGSVNGLPWPGVLELTLTYNRGIAFGMFQGLGVLMAPIGIAIAWFAGRHSMRHPSAPSLLHVALGLLASGAIGNLIDRVFLGQVTDMFAFRFIDFPVFNVADSCITVSAIALVFLLGREAKPIPESQESASI